MNAGGVDKACKSNGLELLAIRVLNSGERVSNTLVTYPEVGHNLSKDGLIPHNVPTQSGLKSQDASG